MLNLLIALMGGSYERVSATEQRERLKNRIERIVMYESEMWAEEEQFFQMHEAAPPYMHVLVPEDDKASDGQEAVGVINGVRRLLEKQSKEQEKQSKQLERQSQELDKKFELLTGQFAELVAELQRSEEALVAKDEQLQAALARPVPAAVPAAAPAVATGTTELVPSLAAATMAVSAVSRLRQRRLRLQQEGAPPGQADATQPTPEPAPEPQPQPQPQQQPEPEPEAEVDGHV